MCNASNESFILVCISFSYIDKLGAIYGDVMTKNMKIDDLTVVSVVWFTVSALSDLSLKPQTSECMLTFKVKVKVKYESFNSCLQL